LHEIRERRQAEAEMQLLRDVAIGVGVAEDLEQAVRHVLIQICNTTEWDFAEVWVPDSEQNRLICYPAWFTRRPGMEEFRRVSLPLTFVKGEGFPGKAWTEARPIVLHELGDPERFVRATAAVKAGLKSAVAVPVLSGDYVELILCFYLSGDEDLAASRLKVVAAVAAQIGLLIGRKKAEDEVRMLNQDLERRVMERTEELLAANRELESFSYTVSHDLRAPLRAINGFSNLLSESNAERLDEKGRRYLLTIAEATRRMGQLIDDLLMFAKLNRQQIRTEPVSLDGMFDEMLEELHIIEGFRDVAIERGELPLIQGDRLLIRQAFFNLLSNAFKFTRKRADARIVITGERQPGSVVVSIADNGTGFDMKYANHLFNIFQRLHSEDDFEGTGVGLSIVHRIVHRHGGRVWFEATPGEGATFSVMLPVQGEPE
jgi:signal transduction histidine kinase